jgi:predicted nucleic acid-binding Zn ribbon protein
MNGLVEQIINLLSVRSVRDTIGIARHQPSEQRRYIMNNPQHHKICLGCKKPFDTKFLQQVYCSDKCRLKIRDKKVSEEMKEYKDRIFKELNNRRGEW